MRQRSHPSTISVDDLNTWRLKMAWPGHKLHSLSIIDQTICRTYVRNLICFSFPDASLAPQAIKQLKDGLQHTLARWPYLAGTVGMKHPRLNTEQAELGLLFAHYTTKVPDVEASGLLTIERHSLATYPHTYGQLTADGLPPSKLPGHIFCGLPNVVDMTNPQPVLSVQLNFINGGLIIGVCSHHSIMDGTGLATFYQRWANTVKYGSAYDPKPPEDLYDSRLSLMNQVSSEQPTLAQCPEFRIVEPVRLQPVINLPRTTARIFTFSAARLRSLQIMLKKQLPQFTANPSAYVSTMDCLGALIWTHTTRARSLHIDSNAVSKLGFTMDVRSKIGLPDDYIGNAAFYTYASLPIHELIEGSRLLTKAAYLIRQANESFTARAVSTRLTFMASLPDPRSLACNINFTHGIDVYFNCWKDLGADADFGIVGTRSSLSNNSGSPGKPDRVRKPYSADDGGNIVLPRRNGKDINYEILVQLRCDDMERICQDSELAGWAERVVA